MIQCHVFNSLARLDVRSSGTYKLSQFVGGMAAPLFLFMAGMTFGFQMEGLDRKGLTAARRWLVSLRRAGYILGIAYLFRFTNWVFTPRVDWHEILRVDILNCMGAAMLAVSVLAIFQGRDRVRLAAVAGLAIAAAAPVVANLPWAGVPQLIRDYVAAGAGNSRFPLFPCAAYVAFGLSAGAVVRRMAEEGLNQFMQWAAALGLGLVVSGQYFSNIPFSIYPKSNFWTDSPALIVIRLGLMLLIMGAIYLWTGFRSGAGWSWVACLGKSSLLVYWAHLVLVYGAAAIPFKRALEIHETALAVLVVTAAMVGLAAVRQSGRLKSPLAVLRPQRVR